MRTDDAFSKAVAAQTKKALEAMEPAQQEALLKTRMEEALKSLDRYLENQRPQPR